MDAPPESNTEFFHIHNKYKRELAVKAAVFQNTYMPTCQREWSYIELHQDPQKFMERVSSCLTNMDVYIHEVEMAEADPNKCDHTWLNELLEGLKEEIPIIQAEYLRMFNSNDDKRMMFDLKSNYNQLDSMDLCMLLGQEIVEIEEAGVETEESLDQDLERLNVSKASTSDQGHMDFALKDCKTAQPAEKSKPAPPKRNVKRALEVESDSSGDDDK